MSISLNTLQLFKKYFTGNPSAYGVHVYKPVEKGKKEEGKSWTETKLVHEDLYTKHLEGETGLGIVPINKNKCSFSVIDVDIYNRDLKYFVDIIYKNNLPLLPFRTKSGGLHLYTFYKEPVIAKSAREYMEYFVALFGLPKKTERFPKQDNIGANDQGSWINLPYFNCENTKQYMYGPNCEALDIDSAMLKIAESQYDIETVKESIKSIPLSDAPPCLQNIYLMGRTNYRNNYLFSLAAYYKSKYGSDFEFKILEANYKLDDPIDAEELSKTIISTHKRKDYTYKCKDEPICSICSKEECKTREYGIGGQQINQLTYEDFYQYNTDPPYYEWKVNDKSLKFYNELDIIHQTKFRQLCMRHLHILPYRLKDEVWTKIVNNALINVIVQDISIDQGISTGTIFMEYLAEYFEDRTQAQTKEQILLDRVYKDKEKGYYVFRPKNLLSFLFTHKQFKTYSLSKIHSKLKELGGGPKLYYVSVQYKRVRVWVLPIDVLKQFVQNYDKIIDIDFKEDYSNEPF